MKKALKVLNLIGIIGITIIGTIFYKKKEKELEKEKDFRMKMMSYYMLFNRWMKLKQDRKSIIDYFVKNNINKIAIYGYKELGERLYNELKETSVGVEYIIDKNIDTIKAEIDVYSPDEELPEVDAIVVTSTYYYDEIENELCNLVDCQIISLEDVII